MLMNIFKPQIIFLILFFILQSSVSSHSQSVVFKDKMQVNYSESIELSRYCKEQHCTSCPESVSKCTECETGFYLTIRKLECVDYCPIENGYFDDNGKCTQCSEGCSKCSNTTECEKCLYTNNGQCVSECPAATYVDENNVCQKCKFDNCLHCYDDGQCYQCQDGLFLNHYQCVDQCPDKSYADILNECLPCMKSCASCLNSSTCLTCIDGLLKSPDTIQKGFNCVSRCLHNQYQDGDQCLGCDPSCYSCTGPNKNQCTECLNSNQYVNQDKECATCDQNCKICDQQYCTLCESNYMIENSKCVLYCSEGYQYKGSYCQENPDNSLIIIILLSIGGVILIIGLIVTFVIKRRNKKVQLQQQQQQNQELNAQLNNN